MDRPLPPCNCGARDWVLHGTYRVTAGRRQRVRCKACGRAPHIMRAGLGPTRAGRIDRARFWEVVLRAFPFLRVGAALQWASRIVEASPASVSGLVEEVVEGDRELPAAQDGLDQLLLSCLGVYRRRASPPDVSTGSGRVCFEQEDAVAFWRALVRARGIASLVWDPRSGPLEPTDLRTGEAAPMPGALDFLAPEVDPWRSHYPPSPFGASYENVLAFPERVRAATPVEWWRIPAAEAWLDRWASRERLAVVSDDARGGLMLSHHLQTWLWIDRPPVPDPLRLEEAMLREGERLQMNVWDPTVRDSEIDRSFRYFATVSGNELRVCVCTRRTVVGEHQEALATSREPQTVELHIRYQDLVDVDLEAQEESIRLGDIEVPPAPDPFGAWPGRRFAVDAVENRAVRERLLGEL